MRIDATIDADRATPTVAVSIGDARLRERALEVARQIGFVPTAVRAAARVLVADAMIACEVPVIVIGSERVLVSAWERGAAGGLRRDFSALQFERTLLAVTAGLRCFDLQRRETDVAEPAQPEHALADDTDATGVPLTARESEVLALMTTGASNKQIARALDFSVHTAKFHVAAIIAKLGVKGRTEAVARALSAGRDMI